MQPSSPTPQYDFILNGGQAPAKKTFGSLPKPLLFVAGAVILILVIIIWSSLSSGKSTNTSKVVDAMARAQEISRVSQLIESQSKDSNTQALAVTVQTTLSSQQAQMTAYLKNHGKKVSDKELAIYKDSGTDSQLQSAALNNNLEPTYDTYLKNSLATYNASLSTAYSSASGSLKPQLNDAYKSNQVILDSPQLKNPGS